MKVQILGIQRVDMIDQETNKSIKGLSLHLCDADVSQTKDWFGRHCAKVFVSDSIVGDLNLEVNNIIQLVYSMTLGSKKAVLTGIQVVK